ncbi:hypothetical protein QYM36_004915 [Artemia franciscana]|uniref:Uncharacterized protein n=1 Tax=Artemia franciscana TaxID=6661 RepID=A0AA88I0E2_ARTSF|nr:hypothetical protein QYM36_004915 [Artemia franciscana]
MDVFSNEYYYPEKYEPTRLGAGRENTSSSEHLSKENNAGSMENNATPLYGEIDNTGRIPAHMSPIPVQNAPSIMIPQYGQTFTDHILYPTFTATHSVQDSIMPPPYGTRCSVEPCTYNAPAPPGIQDIQPGLNLHEEPFTSTMQGNIIPQNFAPIASIQDDSMVPYWAEYEEQFTPYTLYASPHSMQGGSPQPGPNRSSVHCVLNATSTGTNFNEEQSISSNDMFLYEPAEQLTSYASYTSTESRKSDLPFQFGGLNTSSGYCVSSMSSTSLSGSKDQNEKRNKPVKRKTKRYHIIKEKKNISSRKRKLENDVKSSTEKELPKEPSRFEWSNEDMQTFLKLLKEHGSNKVISENLMPHKSEQDIRNFLAHITAASRHRYKSQSRYDKKLEMLILEYWLEKPFFSGYEALKAMALPQALSFIAEFEGHASPEESNGVDYAAIYRYLADCSTGSIPKELNLPSAKLLLDIINKMDDECDDRNLATMSINKDAKKYIQSIKKVRTWEQSVYPRTTKPVFPTEEERDDLRKYVTENRRETLDRLCQEPSINPFSFGKSQCNFRKQEVIEETNNRENLSLQDMKQDMLLYQKY